LADFENFLQIIKKSGFNLNLKKCRFAQNQVKFLGHIIGSNEKKPDPSKVSTIKDMKVPETKRQVRRLVGFFSYFRDYIQNFAEIAQPLTDLTKKENPYQNSLGDK